MNLIRRRLGLVLSPRRGGISSIAMALAWWFSAGVGDGCVPAGGVDGFAALAGGLLDRVFVVHAFEDGQCAAGRAVDDSEVVLLEVWKQGFEAFAQGIVERVVVADDIGGSCFIEGVPAIVGHLEIAPEQVHGAEAEVVEQSKGGEHDASFALDAQRIGLVAIVAPRNTVASQEALVVEVITSAIEQYTRHLADMECTGAHGTVGFLNSQSTDAMTHRHELGNAGVLPAGVDESAGVIDAGPEGRAVDRPGVVDAHRDDAALVEE